MKQEKDIKKEEDSDSPKTKRARIEMTEPEDVIKQEQLDKEKESEAMSINTTPDPVRTRRFFHDRLHVNSPSDALMSPCTAMLSVRGNKCLTCPAAALRMKQNDSVPFKLGKE